MRTSATSPEDWQLGWPAPDRPFWRCFSTVRFEAQGTGHEPEALRR